MSRSPAAVLLAVLLPLAGLLDASHPAAAEDKAGKSIVDQLSDFLRGGSKAGPGTADQPPAAGAPAASPAAPAAGPAPPAPPPPGAAARPPPPAVRPCRDAALLRPAGQAGGPG